MANVIDWKSSLQWIVFNPKLKKEKLSAMEGRHTICVEAVILDSEIQCMHCGKTVKQGKLVFICKNDNYICRPPYKCGKDGWGEGYNKNTFCSSSHAKLFAKNTN